MRWIYLSLAMMVGASGAFAASEKANCKALADPMGKASQGFSSMYVSMNSLDYRLIAKEFSGDERAQFLKMAQLHEDLLPVFAQYLNELEMLALMMSRCSR